MVKAHRSVLAAVLALAVGLAAPLAAQSGKRAMRVDDLFGIESLQSAVLSPDGEWVAVGIERAATDRETYDHPFLWGNERADVWLVSADGRVRRNLTNGIADGSGYWSPVWSPDGRRLAMLSTKGGDNVRLFVWERGATGVRRVSSRPVDLQTAMHHGRVRDGEARSFTWLSPTELLFAALPDSMRSDFFDVEIRTQRIATQAWQDRQRGRTAQVSVLDSPVGVGDTTIERTGALVRVDLARRGSSAGPAERVVGRVSLAGFTRAVVLSPRNELAAVREALFAHPRPGEPFNIDKELNRARFGVMALDGSSPAWWVDSVPPDPSGLAWSADGVRLAVLGTPTSANAATPGGSHYLLSPGTRSVTRATGAELSVTGVEWGGPAVPLVYATTRGDSSTPPAWWAVTSGAAPRLLTSGVAGPSPNLTRVGGPGGSPDGEQLLVSGAGDLWLIHAASGEAPTNLTASFQPRIASVVWPQSTESSAPPQVIVETEAGAEGAGKFYRLELSGRQAPGVGIDARPAERPAPEANLLAYHPSQRLALFGTFTMQSGAALPTASDGPTLWAGELHGGNARTLVRLNPHLDAIVEPETRFTRYRGLDGDSLIASVTLPVGYVEGTRYPVVVFAYAGSMVRDTLRPHMLLRKNSSIALNLQPLAARGYVVLMPSMPLPEPGARRDAYLELMKGVLPAIDRLIDLGIADPKRLGVMGQSFGGFSTYGLITQTSRFGAAVALAGPVDWISSYGIFDPRSRYTPVAQQFALPGLIETIQPSLGASPWENLWAYLRNSPLYYLDRVETPLLIIQGDVDYVPMAQGEIAFTAMLRMGKRARFVRYWGEGHVLTSPANIRDMWARIFAWFDEHLRSPDTP